MMPKRVLILLSLVLWGLVGCDDGGNNEESDVLDSYEVEAEEELTPLPDQSFTLRIEASYSDLEQSYSFEGTDYEISIEEARVVVGNLSVLRPGEAVPRFVSDSGERDPLDLAENAIEGYKVVDLLTGDEIGPIDIAGHGAGPAYFAFIVADQSANPLEGKDEHPEIDDVTFLVSGSLRSGELIDKGFVLRVPWERLVIAAAPALESTSARVLTYTVDLDGLFADIEVMDLKHTANVIRLEDGHNEAAYGLLSERAIERLEGASLVLQ